MQETALRYLEQSPLAHIDMLEVLRRGTATVLAADAEGVLLQDPTAELHMLSAATPQAAARLTEGLSRPFLATAHQPFSAAHLEKKYGLKTFMTCHQALWCEKHPPAVPPMPLEIRPLPVTMAEEVAALYSHDIGLDYIKSRLAAGEIFGAFSGGQLAGFIGLHAEGSMGMLEVKPAFRRQGIAARLGAFLCARLLAVGRTPFSQYTLDNTASQSLHAALGFTTAPGYVYWLE